MSRKLVAYFSASGLKDKVSPQAASKRPARIEKRTFQSGASETDCCSSAGNTYGKGNEFRNW